MKRLESRQYSACKMHNQHDLQDGLGWAEFAQKSFSSVALGVWFRYCVACHMDG